MAFSITGVAFAESTSSTNTSTVDRFAAQQAYTAAIKQANATYNAAIKKANADYKAAVDAAKATRKKAEADARAAMKSSKEAAQSALKAVKDAGKESRQKKDKENEREERTTIKVRDTATLGKIIVAGNNMTLYLRQGDSATTSTCYDTCASNWPPYVITGQPRVGENATGTLGLLVRTDGKTQVTYNGKPLYFWQGDVRPGDTSGNGVGGIWWVVAP